MKMTEEESDVFEITDFTTASDWERFIARLEEIIHEWKLTAPQISSPLTKGEIHGTWEEISDDLQFADFKFSITRHVLRRQQDKEVSPSGGQDDNQTDAAKLDAQTENYQESAPSCWMDLVSVENDFPSRAHCLVRWYGLHDFVILAPAINSENISSESRANIVLSSVSIALHNTGCQVPMFVQVQQKWRKLYYGQCETTGFRTAFEMVHLKQAPPQYSHLAGLLDVFKSKLNSPVSPLPPVSVSVRFTYVLQDWPHYSWPQLPPDLDSMMGGEVGCVEFGDLPFGACEDPVSELHLSTTWPSLSEEMIVDNDVYSDLDPLQAPVWCVRVRMTDDPQCLLGAYMMEFVKLCRRQESTDQLLGKFLTEDDANKEGDISQALQRLTEPVPYALPSIGTVVTKATSKLQIKPEEAPIAADLLNDILLYLFPDAKTEEDTEGCEGSEGVSTGAPSTPSSEKHHGEVKNTLAGPHAELVANLKEMFRQFKAAPEESLSFRLAVCICIVNHSYGGLRAVAHLWQEFVLEMRYRWENNFLIPDLDPGSPNLGSSLLHQKLQMLNCCIRHKMSREAMQSTMASTSSADIPDSGATKHTNKKAHKGASGQRTSRTDLDSSGNSSEEEFFECSDDEDVTEPPGKEEKGKDCDIKGKNKSVKEGKKEGKEEEGKEEEGKEKEGKDDEEGKGEEDKKEGKEEEGAEKEEKEGKEDKEGKEKEGKEETQDATDDSHSELEQMETDSSETNKNKKEDEVPEEEKGKSQKRPRKEGAPCGDVDTQEVSFKDSLTHQPDGRLRPCGTLRLLNGEDLLYIPVTQEPAPMTEDLLEEHAEVLAKLGTSSEGATLRARMQSACLLSDMESFKAANPGCSLGDFVRWYSPRDWVEEETMEDDGTVTKKGCLSARMQIPGNMWVEVWQGAKPVPVRRQKRLFDDTKEAEKVLHWLSSMKPAMVASRLMPMLILGAISKLITQEESSISAIKNLLNQIITKATKVMRAPRPDIKKFEELTRQVSLAEVLITRAQSLRTKFSQDKDNPSAISKDLQEFIARLLEQPEVTVLGSARGPVGSIIHTLFATAQKSAYMLPEDEEEEGDYQRPSVAISDFPCPAGKEYILRTTCARPAPWSRPSPQRMFCVVMKEDFRLAGAFTSDTTFQ